MLTLSGGKEPVGSKSSNSVGKSSSLKYSQIYSKIKIFMCKIFMEK